MKTLTRQLWSITGWRKHGNRLKQQKVNLHHTDSQQLFGIFTACFYGLTAVLYRQGKSFRKHTAVRAALHRDLIKTEKVDSKWGRFYNRVFDRRQEGDYEPLVTFDSEQV